jgi:hypothetical protein
MRFSKAQTYQNLPREKRALEAIMYLLPSATPRTTTAGTTPQILKLCSTFGVYETSHISSDSGCRSLRAIFTAIASHERTTTGVSVIEDSKDMLSARAHLHPIPPARICYAMSPSSRNGSKISPLINNISSHADSIQSDNCS